MAKITATLTAVIVMIVLLPLFCISAMNAAVPVT